MEVTVMKRMASKILIGASFLLIGAGAALTVTALSMADFRLDTVRESKTEHLNYSVEGDLRSLKIQTVSDNAEIIFTESSECYLEYCNRSNLAYSITEKDGVLTIEQQDNKKWYEHLTMFFDWGQSDDEALRIYLPEGTAPDVTAETVSGDISVSEKLFLPSADLSTVSGNISLSARVRGNVHTHTVSGNITFGECRCNALSAQTTSGSIKASAIAETTLLFKTISGDIRLDSADASDITLDTVSGDISGSLRSNKSFTSTTVSGSINVPQSGDPSGSCRISTISGDARITVAEQKR